MQVDSNIVTVLRQIAGRLVQLANASADRRIAISETDHLGFMTICMVNKLKEHLRTVCILFDNTCHRDAALIARCMLEGHVRLLWATHEPNEQRALRWRSFSWIHDWRLMKRQEKEGIVVDPKRRSEIEFGVGRVADLFYTKEARKALAGKQPLPVDPYQRSWAAANVETMMNVVSDGSLYELYRLTSGWAHSTVDSVGRAIQRDENRFDYDYNDPPIASIALALGIQTMIESLRLLDSQFDLHLGRALDDLESEYIANTAAWQLRSEG